LGSALCFRYAALAMLFAIAMILSPAAVIGADAPAIPPDLACPQIRDAVHSMANAERNEALALHLMADGKPTPVVQTRLTELQTEIGNLREVLRRARKGSPHRNADVQECISMGFRSLTDAENISRQIEDIVMGEGGPLGLPPQIKSGESDAEKLPEPPLPPAPSHAE
jgi:hypothetical protein